MNQTDTLHLNRMVVVILLVFLATSCATYRPTNEELTEAREKNYYGEILPEYKKLIVAYIMQHIEDIPREVAEGLSISRPYKTWYRNKETGDLWWGWASKVRPVGRTNVRHTTTTKFKNGVIKIERLILVSTKLQFYFDDEQVYGTNPFSDVDRGIEVILVKKAITRDTYNSKL